MRITTYNNIYIYFSYIAFIFLMLLHLNVNSESLQGLGNNIKQPVLEIPLNSNLIGSNNGEGLVKKNGCKLPKNIKNIKNIKPKVSFDEWLDLFKIEALKNGISNDIVEIVFRDISPIQKVIKLDRRQTEYSITFHKYLKNSISIKRIKRGQDMLKKYHTLLNEIEKRYGVQAQILISLWAMESNFGRNMGGFSTINTLATLAHDGRRHEFFRNELICALSILEEEHISFDKMKSSWAGAMGQPQFMPSTFFYYSADGDADNKKDIWHNKTDVFASAANYLKEIGWKPGERWGLEVKLPKKFDPYHARLAEEKSIKNWHKLGVKKANGQPLSINSKMKGSIILPSGIKGPAFLVFHNFRVIRDWNRSINYALTIGYLSDRLIGGRRLVGKAPKGEKALSREQALSLQRNLNKLGFYKEKIDGMIGLKSRHAIREYQRTQGMPADAYPSPQLILQVQKSASLLESE
ncbi:lytic murein transglycosylase [Candidatus Venteria ishoeyi]|uniref:Membrane-bound lytic murein transglycosylase B n=1 Tax=Candidatus Venteria ishoeyi TaxID=1899563 RepID=A0A1H6FFZ5_9GAMM|nr:lytic murein transglycosylase [Candidatus Venteria ishoeyi]SEH08998.1 Membrane-bound lytic murein transglycosylase B precursor [Candidatus Venteria ishoeyi]